MDEVSFNYVIVAVDNQTQLVKLAQGYQNPVSEVDFFQLRQMIDANPIVYNITAPYTLVVADMELSAKLKYGADFVKQPETKH